MPFIVKIGAEQKRVTCNVQNMFVHALGSPLESLDNMTGHEAFSQLWPAVAMIYRPDDYSTLVAMEPKNGNGNIDTARHFLVDLMELCSNNPTEILSINVQGNKNPVQHT